MKFTILGADGFIGSYLSTYLAGKGHDVNAVGRKSKYSKTKNLGHVIFAIGLTSDFRARPLATVDAHVCALKNLLESGNFESLLYLSSTRVYVNGASTSELAPIVANPKELSELYNLSKLMGESLCLNGSDKLTRVVRLSNIFGRSSVGDFVSALVQQAKNGHIELSTTLQSEKDYLHVDALGPILERIICYGQKRLYNVASGVNVRNEQIVDILRSKFNCTFATSPGAEDWSFKSIEIDLIKDEFSFTAPAFKSELCRMLLF